MAKVRTKIAILDDDNESIIGYIRARVTNSGKNASTRTYRESGYLACKTIVNAQDFHGIRNCLLTLQRLKNFGINCKAVAEATEDNTREGFIVKLYNSFGNFEGYLGCCNTNYMRCPLIVSQRAFAIKYPSEVLAKKEARNSLLKQTLIYYEDFLLLSSAERNKNKAVNTSRWKIDVEKTDEPTVFQKHAKITAHTMLGFYKRKTFLGYRCASKFCEHQKFIKTKKENHMVFYTSNPYDAQVYCDDFIKNFENSSAYRMTDGYHFKTIDVYSVMPEYPKGRHPRRSIVYRKSSAGTQDRIDTWREGSKKGG